MPGLLTIQHALPFAIMGDTCIAKIEQCREKGEDYTIKVWFPKDEESIKFLGKNTMIATVITQEVEDAQDDQTVAESP